MMLNPPTQTGGTLLVIGEEDKAYLPRLGPAFAGTLVKATAAEFVTIAELVSKMKAAKLTRVATTRQDILQKLLPTAPFGRKKPSINNYAGSIVKGVEGTEFLILNPLKQLVSVAHGEFMA